MSTNSPLINKQQRIGLGTCIWLVLTTTLIAVGGVDYALVRNDLSSIHTEIERTRRATADTKISASTYIAKANQQTHRWALLDRLNQTGSELRPIERDQIETMESDLYLPLNVHSEHQQLSQQERVELDDTLQTQMRTH